MERGLAAAGVVAVLVGIGAPPAAANPSVVVVDCPRGPTEVLKACQGQVAVFRCADLRSPSECRGHMDLKSMWDKVGASPTKFRSAVSAGIAGYEHLGAIGQNRSVELVVEVDHRGVSVSISSDKKPPDPGSR